MPNMKREEWAQAAEHLEEIRQGIEELLADAEMTLDECDCGIVARRAKAYWLAHIADALGTEDKFAMCTMRDTIRELTNGDSR